MPDGTSDKSNVPPPRRRITFQETPARPAAEAPKPAAPKAPAPTPNLPAKAKPVAPAKRQGRADLSEPAPARPVPGAKPLHRVGPVAKPARPRRRHYFLFLSFLAVVVLPAALAAFYLWNRAADQYASTVAFSVRTEDQSSAVELLGGITELSGSSSSDTDILYAYLTSQELVSRVDAQVDLREIWSKPGPDRDPFFAFDPAGTIEDLQAHWERKINIVYDSGTGLIDLRVLAFDPQDALRIAQVVLEECSGMINGLSELARQDAISFTQDELDNAIERLKSARQAVTAFRNRNQIVDPTIDTQSQMGLLTSLEQQLAEALIEYDLLQDTTRESDPRISQAERRIEAINDRIASERRNLGLGEEAQGGEAFANLVGEFEELLVDREFAERSYTAALANHDSALAEARRQSRYLAAHVKPTLAQKAEYPERIKVMGLWLLFAFFSWAILCLVYYSLRDRS